MDSVSDLIIALKCEDKTLYAVYPSLRRYSKLIQDIEEDLSGRMREVSLPFESSVVEVMLGYMQDLLPYDVIKERIRKIDIQKYFQLVDFFGFINEERDRAFDITFSVINVDEFDRIFTERYGNKYADVSMNLYYRKMPEICKILMEKKE
jgi:hypothetical protein